MKTFYQLVEAIKKNKLENKPNYEYQPNSEMETILTQVNNKEDVVRFALYCAEDCFDLNDDRTRDAAQNCINLLKQWLDDQKSVTREQLKTAATVANNTAYNTAYNAVDAAHAAAYAARAAAASFYGALNTAIEAVRAAVHAARAIGSDNDYYYTNEHESIRLRTLNQYKAYALSLLRTSSIKDKHQIINYKGKIGDKGKPTGRITDKMDILALLDYLEEHGEDLVQQVGNEFHLNFPSGMTIIAKNKNELVDKIWDNQAVLHYLERLYK